MERYQAGQAEEASLHRPAVQPGAGVERYQAGQAEEASLHRPAVQPGAGVERYKADQVVAVVRVLLYIAKQYSL